MQIFYCEQAAGFSGKYGYQDASFFDALVRMFEKALVVTMELPEDDREPFIERLEAVAEDSQEFGYGVGDDLDSLLAAVGDESLLPEDGE